MKEKMILFLKGMVIGFGKIIPGVSGSLLAMSLGVYETALYKIRYFFQEFIKNVTYFCFLGFGILLAITLGSKLILYCLDQQYVLTMFLFIGLLLGMVPAIYEKVEKKDKKYYLVLTTTIILLFLFLNLQKWPTFVYQNDFLSNLKVGFMGFLEAFTMIVPGISGTAIFIILGYYEFVMSLFSDLFTILLESPIICFIFIFAFLVSAYLISIFMNYLLTKKEKVIYAMIEGFGYVSVISLVSSTLKTITTPYEIGFGIILLLLGFFISQKLE